MVVIRTEMCMTTIHSKEIVVIRAEMCMTKTHSKEMDSHSYRNVNDENPYTRIWIVIFTNMYMTKKTIRIWIVIRTNMYMTKTHKNMDSHSFKDVYDKTYTRTYDNMDIKSTKIEHNKTYNQVNINL